MPRPEQQFQDGLAVGEGVGTGSRRAMPIVGAAHSPWLFWDGRKDSLWSQALGPLEDAVEHGSNRTRICAAAAGELPGRVRGAVRAHARPESDCRATRARRATPAEKAAWARAWTSAAAGDVNRVFANIGKAIAAYERTLAPGESRFDRYARRGRRGRRGRAASVLSAQEVRGLRLFIGKGQCVTCHNGPLFTDQHFHNTGVPPREPAQPDRGRAAATAKVQRDEFNCLGPFSDASPSSARNFASWSSDDPALEGAFKTPSLRDVALRAPYMHAGQFASLDEVVAHYAKSPPAAVGHSELVHAGTGRAARKPIRLSEAETREIVAFLQALSGPIVDGSALQDSR